MDGKQWLRWYYTSRYALKAQTETPADVNALLESGVEFPDPEAELEGFTPSRVPATLREMVEKP